MAEFGLKAVLLALFLLTMTSPALAFQKGDRVLAQFRGYQYWFPGVVGSVSDLVTVLYDDGIWDTRPANQVKAYDWAVGSCVACRWKGAKGWYGGTISRIDSATKIRINYDDGEMEDTVTGLCRAR